MIFGSFVTNKRKPNDVDILLVMADAFDASTLRGEAPLLFDHGAAQAHFGASVFWLRRLAAWPNEQAAVEFWQARAVVAGGGIVEVMRGRHHHRQRPEFGATLERIRPLQTQVIHLRKTETNPANYHLSASGFLAEIDRMHSRCASTSPFIPVS